MDKERKSLLTQELVKAEAAVVGSIRNSDAFVRVRTIYATLDKGEPGIYIGIDPAVKDVVIVDLRKELRKTKTALTKATELATTKPETTIERTVRKPAKKVDHQGIKDAVNQAKKTTKKK